MPNILLTPDLGLLLQISPILIVITIIAFALMMPFLVISMFNLGQYFDLKGPEGRTCTYKLNSDIEEHVMIQFR